MYMGGVLLSLIREISCAALFSDVSQPQKHDVICVSHVTKCKQIKTKIAIFLIVYTLYICNR